MPPKSEIVRRVQMQDIGDAFAIKRPTTSNNLIYIYRLLYQNFRITANQKSTIDTNKQSLKKKYIS